MRRNSGSGSSGSFRKSIQGQDEGLKFTFPGRDSFVASRAPEQRRKDGNKTTNKQTDHADRIEHAEGS